jgi:ATP-binding cassette subfamily B protein RaxB
MIVEGLNFGGKRRLPIVSGVEAAECGLACLTMIARFHGHDVDLNGLRQRHAMSMAGATLRGVMDIADQLGFSTRALRVELDALAQISLPAILHWDLNHFVVLKHVGPTKIVIHDPAQGARSLNREEFSKHFTGVALELTPSHSFEPIAARAPVRLTSLWSKATGLYGSLGQILLLSAALQIAAFVAPFQMQLVIDEAVFRSDKDLLAVIAVAFAALVILQATIEWLRSWALQVLGQMMSFQMIGNLMRHLLRLKADFFEKRHVGDVLSRISSARSIQTILTQGVIAAIIDGAMAVLAGAILFFYSPVLALVVVATVLINLIATIICYPAIRQLNEESLVQSATEQSHVMESVRAAITIKLMGREAERESTWRNLFARTVNANIAVGKWTLSLTTIQSATTGLQTVLVIYLGARSILAADGMSVGMLVAFLSFRQTFTDRCNALVAQSLQFRLVGLHLERLSDLITAEPESRPGEMGSLAPAQGAMALTGVSFRYGSTDRWVLEDVSLDIEPGEFIAITGASGGGKTTLLKLLLGLQTPSSGQIRIDGLEASPELWRWWRRHVGLVSQDDRLLSGTIADNIGFFDPDLNMEGVIAAAMAARVHDEIMRMPMQYLSLIGDMGSALSGGQRQRVLLARALYRRPSILVLDEGTANLDVQTEELIGELLSSMPITRIVVAHRPALLTRANRVVYLREGRIMQEAATRRDPAIGGH